ncbi:MAG: GNAT family N-acetyltransferase [Lachnospiraceae bacterium]|nr:GNAT family N-acetyltransferase [Lachnospiraceae bacterium]
MELTRIGSNNWGSFSSVIYDAFSQNSNDVLRIGAIEDGKVCGAISLSYFLKEGQAFIDSLYVVPEFRGHGIGRALVEEAERLAGERANTLEAEFYGDSQELRDFFTARGYACIDGEPIYNYDAQKLLSNKQYAGYCSNRLSGVKAYRFADMSSAQKNRVFDLLRENGERNSESNTAGFSYDLSVSVYRSDDMRLPRACLIATEDSEHVNIAQLYGSGKNNPKFILAAIFGFTEAVKRHGAKGIADIGMVAAHPGVKKVFELLFGKRLKPTESGLVHAIKFLGM